MSIPNRSQWMDQHLGQWMNRLGAVNQYRNVDYVVKEAGFYRCLLCETGGMHLQKGHKHFSGTKHVGRHRYVRILEEDDRQSKKKEKAILFRVSMATLMHDYQMPTYHPWKVKAKALLFDRVLDQKSDEEVDLALRKYGLMEKLSLVELALWKSRICDGITFHSMQEMREYTTLESEFDANEYAREMRISCGSEVVIPLVLTYLH